MENDWSKRLDGIERPEEGESQAAMKVKSEIGRIWFFFASMADPRGNRGLNTPSKGAVQTSLENVSECFQCGLITEGIDLWNVEIVDEY